MFRRVAITVLLLLFPVSGIQTTALADDEQAMKEANAKRMEWITTASKVDNPKPPAEVVAELPAPPASETAALADLPEDAADLLQSIYQWKEGEPLFVSTAAPGEVQYFYADELAKRGYMGNVMLDENGVAISPAFSFMCDAGVIRVMAAPDTVPGKTLVALIVVAEGE